MKALERVFEGLLWNSRLIVLSAVVASILGALGLFYLASVDSYYMLSHLSGYASPDLDADLRVRPGNEFPDRAGSAAVCRGYSAVGAGPLSLSPVREKPLIFGLSRGVTKVFGIAKYHWASLANQCYYWVF